MPAPSLILVHGEVTGAWLWDAWRRHLGALGWSVNVLDLRGHGRSLPLDLTPVTLADYVTDLASVCRQIAAGQGRHPVVGGWSMGALIALMYAAAQQDVPALLLWAPPPALEVGGRPPVRELRRFPPAPLGPESFGLDHADAAATRQGALFDLTEEEADRVLAATAGAQESGLACRQAAAGVSIPPGAVRCPALLVYGEADRERPPSLYRRMALYLAADVLAVEGAGRFGIVCGERFVARTAPDVDGWLRRVLRQP